LTRPLSAHFSACQQKNYGKIRLTGVNLSAYDPRMEKQLRTHLIRLASLFEGHTGTSPASVGKFALNDNTFFHRMVSGKGFTVRTFDRVVTWFSDHWPAGLPWPDDFERPMKKRLIRRHVDG